MPPTYHSLSIEIPPKLVSCYVHEWPTIGQHCSVGGWHLSLLSIVPRVASIPIFGACHLFRLECIQPSSFTAGHSMRFAPSQDDGRWKFSGFARPWNTCRHVATTGFCGVWRPTDGRPWLVHVVASRLVACRLHAANANNCAREAGRRCNNKRRVLRRWSGPGYGALGGSAGLLVALRGQRASVRAAGRVD